MGDSNRRPSTSCSGSSKHEKDPDVLMMDYDAPSQSLSMPRPASPDLGSYINTPDSRGSSASSTSSEAPHPSRATPTPTPAKPSKPPAQNQPPGTQQQPPRLPPQSRPSTSLFRKAFGPQCPSTPVRARNLPSLITTSSSSSQYRNSVLAGDLPIPSTPASALTRTDEMPARQRSARVRPLNERSGGPRRVSGLLLSSGTGSRRESLANEPLGRTPPRLKVRKMKDEKKKGKGKGNDGEGGKDEEK
ncbi:hypothetical protein F4677DRAFT_423222 [Hypoxylon crocopeplum]|nr:hypothetical protein F4677DRAFT_423222 [Hypoxylon crocopeplum]